MPPFRAAAAWSEPHAPVWSAAAAEQSVERLKRQCTCVVRINTAVKDCPFPNTCTWSSLVRGSAMKAVESSETSFQRITRNYYHTRTLARRFCSLAVQHIAELTDLAKFWLTQKGEQQKTIWNPESNFTAATYILTLRNAGGHSKPAP